MVNLKNVTAAKQMFELIAERSGEDRANVFLDIIIDIVMHDGRSSTDVDDDDPGGHIRAVWSQQQALNRIAEIYGITPPTLKLISGDIPF